MAKNKANQQLETLTDDREELQEPPLYKVLLHNDDYTTMDFVVLVLEVVFHKDGQEAARIMMRVHQDGKGVAGIFTRDVAETKAAIVHDLAHKNEYPLKCTIEEA